MYGHLLRTFLATTGHLPMHVSVHDLDGVKHGFLYLRVTRKKIINKAKIFDFLIFFRGCASMGALGAPIGLNLYWNQVPR